MEGWEPVRTADGSWTLRHPRHGEACRSLSGAWEEARERYALPCRLREVGLRCSRVRLLDVGTGSGLNLAAALEALEGTGARLEVVTLEADASVLRAAGGLPASLEGPGPWVSRLRALLVDLAREPACATSVELLACPSPATLCLLLGDARRTLPALAEREPFDAVFLDPFSPRIEPELWQEGFLREVAGRMAPEAILSTYSSSLAVRRALRAAGLGVGLGARVGTKSSGTLASWSAPLPPLAERDARRLERTFLPGGQGANRVP